MKNIPLFQSLRARGQSAKQLAAALGTTQAQVSLTLNNRPRRGYRTRPRLAPLLTAEERALVGWNFPPHKHHKT